MGKEEHDVARACEATCGEGSARDTKRKRGGGSAESDAKPLVAAIRRHDWAACEALMVGEDGPRYLRHKNAKGMTPVMMAVNGCCGSAKARLLELMLGHGGVESLAERAQGKTAADMALAQNHHGLAARLRALEPHDEPGRCRLCGEKFKPRGRTPLHFLGDRVHQGTETNALIRTFYVDHASAVEVMSGPIFHRVNSCIGFRKELSETMAVVMALAQEMVAVTGRCGDAGGDGDGSGDAPGRIPGASHEAVGVDWGAAATCSSDWHVLDLCCGKSLTASATALLLPDALVTCVDRCDPSQLPHYTEAGLESRVKYVQVDILAAEDAAGVDPFLDAMAAAHRGSRRPRLAVLGVHCCGALSARAVEVFTTLDADALFLLPCCLPRKDDVRFPDAIFSTSIQEEQYARWADHLMHEAQRRNGTTADAAPVTDVISIKNILVSARRSSTPTALPAPTEHAS